jgi:hypothetical protein
MFSSRMGAAGRQAFDSGFLLLAELNRSPLCKAGSSTWKNTLTTAGCSRTRPLARCDGMTAARRELGEYDESDLHGHEDMVLTAR